MELVMKELVEAGGAGFLIPAVLFAIVLYAVRGIFGLHDQKSKIRREFLELWDRARSQDDLWLEVAVRHWMGTYLPAHVIRLAFEQPDKSQSLIELSELWPFLRYDRSSRTVEWGNRRLRTIERSRIGRFLWVLVYFVSISFALLLAAGAYQLADADGQKWIYSIGAAIFFLGAFASLMRADTAKVIVTDGEEWIRRINDSVSPAGTHSHDGAPDSSAVLR
jgi:hypothetical protein